ncbi:SDR family oxidoreductase [Agrobacterium leguminum]|uniref:SDR family oxidoreductase n=1 Tax=Agrobacterium leguminum TaxID=2792015 RepID=UPI00272C7C4C|nr:SDR family oxidoreductase [Agrobacterium leguminum]WLD96040.1 SDR family oxidoreductase [Agrobacterium leguminum]
MPEKIWFITGASRGFGRIWAEAALKRGDKVAATARNTESLSELASRFGDHVLPLPLDVTDADGVRQAVADAHRYFGRLDIVLNNAGYALVGAIEEIDEGDLRAELDTNVFGMLRVIQASLPYLRAQGNGHIVSVSSVAGIVANPIAGAYNMSKWAVEAMHEALAQEVEGFGIKVTLIEPGAYATDFASATSLRISEGLEAYAPLREHAFAAGAKMEFGDPRATAAAILKLVDAQTPPLRFFLGTEGLPVARAAYSTRLSTWEAWEAESNAAQGNGKQHTIATL